MLWTGTNSVGFQVLTAVVMKNTLFWNITPCSPLKANRRFGGTCRLSLQGRRIIQARNQREGGSKHKKEATFPPKRQLA
jgi:hypothetical protein